MDNSTNKLDEGNSFIRDVDYFCFLNIGAKSIKIYTPNTRRSCEDHCCGYRRLKMKFMVSEQPEVTITLRKLKR